VPGWHEQNLDCWTDSLTVYSGQADVAASDATPGTLAALRWLQAHHPDSSHFSVSEAPRSTSAGFLLGEVVRIHAAATVSEVNTASEWIGRITGDGARPALTMLWDHGSQNGSIACGVR